PARVLAGLAVLAGLTTAIYVRRAKPELSPDTFAWPMAALLFCAPVVFPWYLLWLVPFLISPSTWPIIIWTVCITATYFMWHLSAGGGWWSALLDGVMLVEYGCVAAAAVIIMLRRHRHSIQMRA